MSEKTDLIQTKAVTTLREILNKEMVRLQELRVKKPESWANSSDWAKDEFGVNLDEITPLAVESEALTCQICGYKFGLEEKFICLAFSFCDEYSCGMNICKKCLLLMSSELSS